MMYIAFYNPESKRTEVDTSKNYYQIKFYTCQRGFNDSDFKVLNSRFCLTKKSAKKFEKEMTEIRMWRGSILR